MLEQSRMVTETSQQATDRRSALRITREAELLGGELSAYHSRENLVIGAKFLKEDLPYFVELLGEVVSKTRYLRELSHSTS
jgi:ubiquinol-cytochrome c reductase core subunit 2